MKKLFILVLILSFTTNCFGMTLSQEQYDNLDYIKDKVVEKYPQFRGFSGPANNMKVYGVSEETVQKVIMDIDFDKVNAEKYNLEQEMDIVREKLIDSAITDIEASGKVLKYKDKIKDTLMKERN